MKDAFLYIITTSNTMRRSTLVVVAFLLLGAAIDVPGLRSQTVRPLVSVGDSIEYVYTNYAALYEVNGTSYYECPTLVVVNEPFTIHVDYITENASVIFMEGADPVNETMFNQTETWDSGSSIETFSYSNLWSVYFSNLAANLEMALLGSSPTEFVFGVPSNEDLDLIASSIPHGKYGTPAFVSTNESECQMTVDNMEEDLGLPYNESDTETMYEGDDYTTMVMEMYVDASVDPELDLFSMQMEMTVAMFGTVEQGMVEWASEFVLATAIVFDYSRGLVASLSAEVSTSVEFMGGSILKIVEFSLQCLDFDYPTSSSSFTTSSSSSAFSSTPLTTSSSSSSSDDQTTETSSSSSSSSSGTDETTDTSDNGDSSSESNDEILPIAAIPAMMALAIVACVINRRSTKRH